MPAPTSSAGPWLGWALPGSPRTPCTAPCCWAAPGSRVSVSARRRARTRSEDGARRRAGDRDLLRRHAPRPTRRARAAAAPGPRRNALRRCGPSGGARHRPAPWRRGPRWRSGWRGAGGVARLEHGGGATGARPGPPRRRRTPRRRTRCGGCARRPGSTAHLPHRAEGCSAAAVGARNRLPAAASSAHAGAARERAGPRAGAPCAARPVWKVGWRSPRRLLVPAAAARGPAADGGVRRSSARLRGARHRVFGGRWWSRWASGRGVPPPRRRRRRLRRRGRRCPRAGG